LPLLTPHPLPSLFRAPATPAIYTLSLHDALPISCETAREHVVIADGTHPLAVLDAPRTADLAGLRDRQLLPAVVGDRDPVLHPEDRKSTRLNSSHSQISYAVFCLKNKKR